MPVIEPIKEKVKSEPVATVKKETSAPAAVLSTPLIIEETKSGQDQKAGGLSLFIILGALVLLAGISAFIWKITDDRHYPSATGSYAAKTDTVRINATPARIDSSGIMAEAQPRVIHDTVKLIQIQQRPMAANFKAPPKAADLGEGNQLNNIHVKVMPQLPYFDYMWVDKPYYFDLKTPLMSNDEYELYSDNAAITPLGENTFYVKATQPGPLDVMVLEKESHAKVAEKVYNVKNRSVPVATLGDDITGGFVSPKLLLAKLTMQAKSDNGNYKIKSFHMTCGSGACDINDVSDNGAFNESMINFLKKIKAGEQLTFDNIVAEDESGKTVKLDPFQIITY
jgi:hypothetical protein